MTRSTVAAAVLTAAAVSFASASTIYSTSFERPAFMPGTAAGQDGWVNGSGTGVSQSVVDTFARSGNQSLHWDNTGANQSFYSVRRQFSGQMGAISAATPLEISIWMNIDAGSTGNRLYGLYAMNGGTSTLGGTNLGITVSGDGSVRAGNAWSQTYSGAALYTNAALVGDWIRVALTYDGVGGGAAVYDASNNELWSTTFATVTLGNSNGTGTTWGVNLGTDYFSTTDRAGSAHMDDLMIRIIPVPSSMIALGAGLALATRRRRA